MSFVVAASHSSCMSRQVGCSEHIYIAQLRCRPISAAPIRVCSMFRVGGRTCAMCGAYMRRPVICRQRMFRVGSIWAIVLWSVYLMSLRPRIFRVARICAVALRTVVEMPPSRRCALIEPFLSLGLVFFFKRRRPWQSIWRPF